MRPYARVRMLTREEYEELERMERRRKLAASKVQRARIILLSNRGYLMKEIASQPGCHEKTASRRIGRFNELGMAGLEEYPRGGRPRVYSPEGVGTVIQTALSSPTKLGLPFGSWTLDRLVAYLKEQKGSSSSSPSTRPTSTSSSPGGRRSNLSPSGDASSRRGIRSRRRSREPSTTGTSGATPTCGVGAGGTELPEGPGWARCRRYPRREDERMELGGCAS